MKRISIKLFCFLTSLIILVSVSLVPAFAVTPESTPNVAIQYLNMNEPLVDDSSGYIFWHNLSTNRDYLMVIYFRPNNGSLNLSQGELDFSASSHSFYVGGQVISESGWNDASAFNATIITYTSPNNNSNWSIQSTENFPISFQTNGYFGFSFNSVNSNLTTTSGAGSKLLCSAIAHSDVSYCHFNVPFMTPKNINSTQFWGYGNLVFSDSTQDVYIATILSQIADNTGRVPEYPTPSDYSSALSGLNGELVQIDNDIKAGFNSTTSELTIINDSLGTVNTHLINIENYTSVLNIINDSLHGYFKGNSSYYYSLPELLTSLFYGNGANNNIRAPADYSLYGRLSSLYKSTISIDSKLDTLINGEPTGGGHLADNSTINSAHDAQNSADAIGSPGALDFSSLSGNFDVSTNSSAIGWVYQTIETLMTNNTKILSLVMSFLVISLIMFALQKRGYSS